MSLNEDDMLLTRYVGELGKAVRLIEENIQLLKDTFDSRLNMVIPIEYKVYNTRQMAFPKKCWLENEMPEKEKAIIVNGVNRRTQKDVSLSCIVISEKKVRFKTPNSEDAKGGDIIMVSNAYYSDNLEWKSQVVRASCFGKYDKESDACILDCAKINTETYNECLKTTKTKEAIESIKKGKRPWCFGKLYSKEEERCRVCNETNQDIFSKCNLKCLKSKKTKRKRKTPVDDIINNEDWAPEHIEKEGEIEMIEETLPNCSSCEDGLMKQQIIEKDGTNIYVEICDKCGEVWYNGKKIDTCSTCGGNVSNKMVQYFHREVDFGMVEANVCDKCGETSYSIEVYNMIEAKAKVLGMWNPENQPKPKDEGVCNICGMPIKDGECPICDKCPG